MRNEQEIAKRKAKIAELLAQDRQKLLMRQPFIGSLVMRLDLVPVYDQRLETASTDGDRIYVDLDFYSKLTSDERLFVLAHETWHCALLHFNRRQDRGKEKFNVAADLEIHFLLTEEGFRPPFVLPHDPNWKGHSAEEIYEWLPENYFEKDMGNGQVSANLKNGQRRGFDRHLERGQSVGPGDREVQGEGPAGRAGIGFDSDYSPKIDVSTAERCRERLTAAAQLAQRMRGDLSAGIKRIIEAVLKPEIGWKELLAQFVTSCYGGSRRWLPPARRHIWEGLYLQSQRKETLRAVIAIDTSGSTWMDMPRFFSELTSLLNAFGGYELTIIQCDAAIGKVERFDECNPLDPDRKWEMTGGGGTDFRPVFQYIDEHSELDPSLLIYFTDGWGAYPERPPAYPVMWLLTSDGSCDVNWGTQVRFKRDA